MLASVYRVDVSASVITLTYWTGTAWATENRPLTAYAALYSTILKNSAATPVKSSGTLALCGTGVPYYPDPGDHSVFALPSQSRRTLLPTLRNPIPGFVARKRAGEILVSDYAVGYVDFVSNPARHETVTESIVRWGNFTCAEMYDNTKTNPLSLHGVGLINGKSTHTSYMLVYRKYTYDTTESLSIPLPSEDVVTWDSFPIAIMPSVVTNAGAKAVQGSWDALTELAEFKDTITFVGNHTARVGQTLIQYMKDAVALASRKAAPKVLANHWLQFRYAVTPLMYSVSDVRSAIKELQRTYAEFRAGEDVLVDYPWATDPSVACSPVKSVHRCMIKNAYTPDTMLSSLSAVVGFNPLATAWELTPYSFVADWFVNISDVIQVYTSLHLEDYARSTYSVKYDEAWELTKTVGTSRASLTVNPNCYIRQVITPSDHFGLSFGVNVTWKRALDGVALSLNPLAKIIRKYR